jgi:hypothetical protein
VCEQHMYAVGDGHVAVLAASIRNLEQLLYCFSLGQCLREAAHQRQIGGFGEAVVNHLGPIINDFCFHSKLESNVNKSVARGLKTPRCCAVSSLTGERFPLIRQGSAPVTIDRKITFGA